VTVAAQLDSSEFANLPAPPWVLCERIPVAVLADDSEASTKR
jgi:hypothetical protein